jgi:hypothetical protein
MGNLLSKDDDNLSDGDDDDGTNSDARTTSTSTAKKARSFLDEMSAPSVDETAQLFQFPQGLELLRKHRGEWRPDALNKHSILLEDADTRIASAATLERVRAVWRAGEFSVREKHAMAAMLSLVVGDALGAPLEFRPVRFVF